MRHIRFAALITLSLSLPMASCSKDPEAGHHHEATTSAQTPAAAKTAASATSGDVDKADKADAITAVQPVMAAYEQCRALLAADKGDGIKSCADNIAMAAKQGTSKLSGDAKPHLDSIVTAAQQLAQTAADDLDALRLAYGEVSKPTVALLTAIPAAAKQYRLFECPMAEGYNRWIQVLADEKMANPYMGTKMLECGSEVHDHHQGMK